MIDVLTKAFEPSLIYGIGAIGLALIFRYLRFPDFTVLGSIVVGGIITINVTNHHGASIGLPVGALAGGVLGALTGTLVVLLRIRPVLAGIIAYTASFSIAHVFSKGGVIDIPIDTQADLLLKPVYSRADCAVLVGIALSLVILLAALMKTKLGLLLLAMAAAPKYVTFRHRYQNGIFLGTAIAGNAIVALAGGLSALNERSAQVYSHMEFLPLALGAIFAANAVMRWAAKIAADYRIAPNVSEATAGTDHQEKPGRAASFIARAFFLPTDNSGKVGVLFVTYLLACFVFTLLTRAVYFDAFKEIHPNLSIPAQLQFAVVAALMTVFVALSGSRDE